MILPDDATPKPDGIFGKDKCNKVGRLSTYNTKATCGSTSYDSSHSEESDTPIRRTPFRSGN